MDSPLLGTIHRIVQSIDRSADLSHALDNLVVGIHEALNVDVCSIYLNNKITDSNILMATYGLNPDSVGNVSIPFDEGLVGLVTQLMEPVNIENAHLHPRFKYIPECGEEPFQSFLGIPVIHHGKNLAVLVVQQVSPRCFGDQDIAFLTTLAALIAGNIAFAKARGLIDEQGTDFSQSRGSFEGIAGAPGISIGTGVFSYNYTDISTIPDRKPEDIAEEETRFRSAINEVVKELETIGQKFGDNLPKADRMLFDAFALIAGDEELVDATIGRIRAGNWAQGALRDTIEWYAAKFESLDDAYMRERANDIRNIGCRILGYLQPKAQAEKNYPEKTILVGEDLSPMDLAIVPPEKLAGIVSGHGSAYSHLAILAHALNIPAVLGFSGQLPLPRLDGKTVIVDGYQGRIIVSPSDLEMKEYRELNAEEKLLTENLAMLQNEPAITTDGIRIHLYTNTGLLTGFTQALSVGTEGIGLYRTELPFMSKDSFPSEDEQQSLYRQVLEAYSPLPVTLRTLDIGGDKPLPYFPFDEPNPFLGWRGIRFTLDHPDILMTQLRAMLRASIGFENLRILLPMISSIDELEQAVALIHRACDDIRDEGHFISLPKIGAMIEVPAAVYQIESIARRVDFLTVGTNDLIQYLLAVDRNNELVARLFEPLHPAVLEVLTYIATAAKRTGTHLSICGEAAGDPALVILLIAMKVDSLSLGAGDLPRIKWVIRTFSYEHAREIWQQVRQLEYSAQIRRLLTDELVKHGMGGLIHPGG